MIKPNNEHQIPYMVYLSFLCAFLFSTLFVRCKFTAFSIFTGSNTNMRIRKLLCCLIIYHIIIHIYYPLQPVLHVHVSIPYLKDDSFEDKYSQDITI